MWGTLIAFLLISSASKGQVPTLSVTPNQVEIGSNFTAICHVEINAGIAFFVNGTQKGSCQNPVFGNPCNPPDIQQNVSEKETSWTLTALKELEGSWKCNRQGVDSSTVDVSMHECPSSVFSESGIDSSLSLNDTSTVSIAVKIGCIYPTNNPEILLRFVSSDSQVVPYSAMNCIETSGSCSIGSAYECDINISRGMGITHGPLEAGTNYTLHGDSIVVPSVSSCGQLAIFEPHLLMFETQGRSDTDGKNCDEQLIYVPYFIVMVACVAITFFLVIWLNFRFRKSSEVIVIIAGVAFDIVVEIILLWCIEYAIDFQFFRSDGNCNVLKIGVICHAVALVVEIVKAVVQYMFMEELGELIFECFPSCDPRISDTKDHKSNTILLPVNGDDRVGASAVDSTGTVTKPEDIMLLVHFTVPEGYTFDTWVTEENAVIKDNPKYVSNKRGTLLIKSATERDNGIYQGIFASEGSEQRVNTVLHVTGQKSANLIVNPLIWRQVKTKKLKKISDLKEIRHKVSRNDIDKIPMRNVEESNVNIKTVRWEHNGKTAPSNYVDEDGSVPPLTVTKKQSIDEYHCTVQFTNEKSHVYIFIVKFTADIRSGNILHITAIHNNQVDTVDDVVGVPTILSTRRKELTSSLPPLRHTATTAHDMQTSVRLPIYENDLHQVTARSAQSTGAEDNT